MYVYIHITYVYIVHTYTALMYNCPRAATVTASTDSQLFSLDRDSFQFIVQSAGLHNRELYDKFMQRVGALAGLTRHQRSQIADVLKTTSYAAGENIISEGETTANMFYIVFAGQAVATKASVGVLKEYSTGDCFGELALLMDQPRAATVTAKGPCTCVCIDRASFTRLLGPYQDLLNSLHRSSMDVDEIEDDTSTGAGMSGVRAYAKYRSNHASRFAARRLSSPKGARVHKMSMRSLSDEPRPIDASPIPVASGRQRSQTLSRFATTHSQSPPNRGQRPDSRASLEQHMKEQLDQMREDMARGLAEERDRNEQLLLRVKAHHVAELSRVRNSVGPGGYKVADGARKEAACSTSTVCIIS